MAILDILGLKHPIFLSPMAGVTTPQLAAEVSNHGGLGALGLGASTPAQAREQILATQTLTDRPFQVNFFCHQPVPLCKNVEKDWLDYLGPQFEQHHAQPPEHLNCIYPSFLDNNQMLELVLDTRPAVVSFHFGLPHPDQIQALKEAGILIMVTATNLVEAQLIEAAGADVIIAQGIEAGGHRGIFNPNFDACIGTADLVQLLTQHCKCPVVAAGGIMNGAKIQEMLKLGAQAVQMGTAFISCKTSNAHDAYREALISEPITQISSSISGRPARGLLNQWHTQIDLPNRPPVPPYPYSYDVAKQLHAIASQQHEQGFGAFWAGSQVKQIRPLEAADLLNLLAVEMLQHNYSQGSS